MYEAKAWKETDGPSLRGFNEKEAIDSVNGALALRPQIEKIVDQIWEEGFDGRLKSICAANRGCRFMWKTQRNF